MLILIILIINVSMSFVHYAGVEMGLHGAYYESQIVNDMNTDRDSTYIPLLSEIEQLQQSIAQVTSMLKMLSFDWLWTYIPGGQTGDYGTAGTTVIWGLNAIAGFFAILAMIELYTKRSMI